LDNLVLFGFKSCGKTTLGKRLAKKLARHFIDTDWLIEALYAKEQGEQRRCREIALQWGEKTFRLLEKRVIHVLTVQNAVIAVGGGAVLDEENCQKLRALGTLLYVPCPKEVLKSRLLRPPLPSFLDPQDPEGSFERVYDERLACYEKIEAMRIDGLSCSE